MWFRRLDASVLNAASLRRAVVILACLVTASRLPGDSLVEAQASTTLSRNGRFFVLLEPGAGGPFLTLSRRWFGGFDAVRWKTALPWWGGMFPSQAVVADDGAFVVLASRYVHRAAEKQTVLAVFDASGQATHKFELPDLMDDDSEHVMRTTSGRIWTHGLTIAEDGSAVIIEPVRFPPQSGRHGIAFRLDPLKGSIEKVEPSSPTTR
jgi:hypothetical protein